MRRALVTVLAATVLSTAACGGDETARPTPPSPTEALWNPCDGLRTSDVEKQFDTTLDLNTGTPTAPLCRFTPVDEGDPVVDANYLLFPEGLEAAIETFPETSADARITVVDVPRADDARLVVSHSHGTVLVTGFVENGDLIQVVNAVDPPPRGRTSLVAGVRALMSDLAAHADASGLTTSTP